MGIGTSDFGATQVDVATQGGPSSLDLSSFLQDLSLGAISSPVSRAPVSVLSPNFQRVLDRDSALPSPPPPVRIAVETGVSAVVTTVDVAVDACVAAVDQFVQAVVETGETSTEYDPPVDTLPVAPSPILALSASGTDALGDASVSTASSAETLVEVPGDFSLYSSLTDVSESETARPSPTPVLAVTSPIGPSLLDSDDEPIASRLPG